MKKILSLLSMLMVTVTAFATSYTDKLTYKLTVLQTVTKELPAGELTVDPYGKNYTVTAKGCDFSEFEADNWYEIVCEDVPGTTDANGVTTITLDNPYALRTSDNAVFTDSKLVVKFNGTKAYAHFEGQMNVMFAPRAFEYTFGTNEGFESTGGGETGGGEPGGEDKPAIVDVVEADYAPNGAKFAFPFTINWETQKLVAKLDLSTCSRYTHNEGIITVGTDNGHGDVSLWNPNNGEANCHLYYTHYYYGTDEKLLNLHYLENPSGEVIRVDNSIHNLEPGLVVFTFDKDGLHVGDNLIATPAQMTTLYNSTSLIFGSKEGTTRSYATYKYVKVVPADWTETTEPTEPEVTVKEEKSFTDAISMVVGDMSEEVGQAQVTIKEMTDETISMTLAVVGQEGAEYTASGFTKAVDTEKNRTTYTGSLNVDGDDFDVTALVYTEDTVEKLYMVAKGAEYNYVVGTNPDAATVVSDKTYTSNLCIYDEEEPVVEETEAQVNVTKYSDDTYKITLKDVSMLNQTSDLVFVGKALVDETAAADEPLTIMAKSDGATTNFFGEQMNASFELTEVSADEVKMEFAIESTNFSYMGQFNYEEEKPESEVYTSNLHIYDAAAPETDLFKADKANVEFLATETGEFTLTLKDVTLNEKTQDLVFTGTLPTTEPGGQEPLAEEGEGEVTPDEPAMVLNATADEATATFLGAASATAEFSISYNAADEFMMTFTMKAGEKNYGGEFNYEAKTPAAEPFCKENYVADGNGFEWEIPVDWDTQKIVMSIDPSTCTGSCEHVIGLGAVPTAWNNTLNLYRTSADQMLQGYFQVPGGSNNNTDKFAETVPFLVEVSKAQGFVVNDEVKIAASEMSYLFTLPTVKMGTGEGANDKSRATYNYVKVVDKDWTKDPETGINATTVAEGEFEVFSVDGVKLAKLQKGLNIVRSADGKVKKVLVK